MTIASREILGHNFRLVDGGKSIKKGSEPSGQIFPTREVRPVSRNEFLKIAGGGLVLVALPVLGAISLKPQTAQAAGGGTGEEDFFTKPAPTSTPTLKSTLTPEPPKKPTPEVLTAAKAMERFGIKPDMTFIGEGEYMDHPSAVGLTTVVAVNGKSIQPILFVANDEGTGGFRLTADKATVVNTDGDDSLTLKVSGVVGDTFYRPKSGVKGDGVILTRTENGFTVEWQFTEEEKVKPKGGFPRTTTTLRGSGFIPTTSDYVGVGGLQQAIAELTNPVDGIYPFQNDQFSKIVGGSPDPTKK